MAGWENSSLFRRGVQFFSLSLGYSLVSFRPDNRVGRDVCPVPGIRRILRSLELTNESTGCGESCAKRKSRSGWIRFGITNYPPNRSSIKHIYTFRKIMKGVFFHITGYYRWNQLSAMNEPRK